MAKLKISIVDVWNWLANEILESGELNANDQAVLFQVIAKINRNLWRPVKITPRIVAAAISRDTRTVKNSLEKLEKLGILKSSEAGEEIGGKYYRTASADILVEGTDSAGESIVSAEKAVGTQSATRKRRIFNQP